MDLVRVLIEILCGCGIAALFWYALNKINPPSIVRIIVEVVACIIGILFLAHLAGWDSGMALR